MSKIVLRQSANRHTLTGPEGTIDLFKKIDLEERTEIPWGFFHFKDLAYPR